MNKVKARSVVRIVNAPITRFIVVPSVCERHSREEILESSSKSEVAGLVERA